MSANNIHIAAELNGHWYGWDETAETVTSDTKQGDHFVRKLHLVRAKDADNIKDLQKKLNDNGIGYAEYGMMIIDDKEPSYIDNTKLEIVI
jgi:hypothetical protein